MTIGELAYECLKFSAGDTAFSLSFDDFCNGVQKDDDYLSYSYGRIFVDINAFFGILQQAEKVPLKQQAFNAGDLEEGNEIPISSLKLKPYQIKNVFQFSNGSDWVNLDWTKTESEEKGKTIRIEGARYKDRPVFVEYRPQVQYFRQSDVKPLKNGEDVSVDLSEEYGISPEVYPICIDYVASRQNMESNQQLSVLQKRDAEAYINALGVDETPHNPSCIRRKRSI